MNKHLVPVTPFGEPSRAETRGQGLDADQPPRTPVPKRNASHRASHRKGLQPPHLRELDPPDLRFLTPWRWSSLRRSSSPHPPSALSATSLPPGLLHLGLRHHHPLCHQLSSGTREILGQAPPLLAMVPWAPAGCSQALPPPRSRREARPVMLFLPPSLLPFAVSLSSLICFLPRILPSEFSSFQKMATTGKHRPQGPSWSGLAPFTGTFVLPFLCTPCSLLDPLHFAGHAPRSPAEMPRTLRHWDRSPPTLVGSSALGTALPPYQSPTGLAPGWRGTPARVSPSHKMAVGLSKP